MSKDAFKYLGEKIQNALHQMDGTNKIPFADLFPDAFMQEHSKYNSLEEFRSSLNLPGLDSLEIISDEDADRLISENTDFNDWESMKSRAGEEYVNHKLQN